MTVKARRFTPDVLLSAPRRSAGIPNSDASRVLYTVSTYSFESHKRTSELRVFDVISRETFIVTTELDVASYAWLDDDRVLLLASRSEGGTEVLIGRAHDFSESNYQAGLIPGSAGDLIIKKWGHHKFILACSALTTADGKLYDDSKRPNKHTSGRVYDSLFVRHWDHYVYAHRNSIWYGTLHGDDAEERNGSTVYRLSSLTNALKGTGLSSPIDQSTGGEVNFDISPEGLVFVAKDPRLNPATHTKQNIYVAQRDTTTRHEFKLRQPMQITVPGFEGACSNPKFSWDGYSVAFTSMRRNGYESDKNQIWIIPDIKRPAWLNYFYGTKDLAGAWDRSPNRISWSSDDQSLYVTAEDNGTNALYHLPSNPMLANSILPAPIFQRGVITDIRPLIDGNVFLSGTSLTDSSIYFQLNFPKIQNTNSGTNLKNVSVETISSLSKDGGLFNLSRDQIEEIYYPGAKSKVHAWIIKPSNFDPEKKYPLVYLIHGGPQGAWSDGWSTRWNPMVFAEQGYVVVTPNPTGSTGYGQAFTDAIQGQWGGLPYEDLVKGIEMVERELPYVDLDRMVAGGASYGGYMTNWIQTQPLAQRFKALFTHDGVFHIPSMLATEELWFPNHEYKGPYWDPILAPEWTKWDPATPERLAQGWHTPHLIIHSELDYRIPVTEGLAPFNVLQSKGIKSRLLLFPDENHFVLNPENSLLWHKCVFDWINDAVGLPRWTGAGVEKILERARMDLGWTHGGDEEGSSAERVEVEVVEGTLGSSLV